MKWRDILEVLKGEVVRAVLRVLVGLLAALGAADAVSSDPVVAGLLEEGPKPSGSK